MLRNCFLTLSVLGLLAGCYSDPEGAIGTEIGAAAPAGSDAAPVSNTIPLAMSPGERLNVQVVMQNTGAFNDGTNDWNNTYSLRRSNTLWSWSSTRVPSPPVVTPGNDATFNFVITAPNTPGTYTFGGRMAIVADSPPFGTATTVPNIVVSNATQRRWSCTEAPGSVANTNMTPGQTQNITAVVQNNGTATWTPPGFCLRSMDSPVSFWGGNTCVLLNAPVAPGGTASFSFLATAPLTPGTYPLNRQMLDSRPPSPAGGVGLFDVDVADACFSRTITVGGASQLDAQLLAQNFPATVPADTGFQVTVDFQNSGTEAWLNDGNYILSSLNAPASLWGATLSGVSATAPGAAGTVILNLTSPLAPGNYNHRWRLRKLNGPNAGFFGPEINLPVTVTPLPAYASEVVAQVIPARITVGTAAQFRITMRNIGSQTWMGGTSAGRVALGSRNGPPTSLWGPTIAYMPLGTQIPRFGTYEFVLPVTGPATPGTYNSLWQVRQIQGVGFFGPIATTNGIVVTLCGNGLPNPGEQCDDGNLTSGDGCSDQCLLEAAPLDLAVDAADRTLYGSVENKQLSAVAAGDLNGDAVSELAASEISHVTPAGQPIRNQAGKVHVYEGTAGLFSGVASTVPTGALFQIWGASANDRLGSPGSGGLEIGDVTGDGVPDLLVSAPDADGVGDARLSAGEVYVVRGDPGLNGAGVIDLADGTANPFVAAILIGANAGDRLKVLAAGVDLTGDGLGDIVLGIPTANGGDGLVYVLAGGAAVTGTIDLAAPGAVILYEILGAAPGAADGLGAIAAVGNIGGAAAPDLLLGAQLHDANALNNSGGAWAIFGPITADIDLSLPAGTPGGPSVVWQGAGANTRLGSSVAIANVDGAAAIIGATQNRNGAAVQVGAVDVWTGVVAGTTYDLSLALPPAPRSRILGRDANDNLGTAIAAGDMNQDGFADIAAAASSADGPINNRDGSGDLYLIRGGAGLAALVDLSVAAPLRVIYGAADRDLLGHNPGSIVVSDFDGDGRLDVCVGSLKGSDGIVVAPGRVDCARSTF